MHEEYMAFVLDEASYRTARAAAQGRGYPLAVVQQGGLELLGDMLESNAPPRILLLDLDQEQNILEAAQRALSLCGPDCRIIFAASKNDVSLYRQFIRMGAADYLVKPLVEEVINQAIVNATAPLEGHGLLADEARGGKIIPVIGTRGGVGGTTLTVNMAWYMAHKLKLHVCLLDLDVHFGASALALDREPGRGLRAALENPERLDGLLIASSMVQESEELSILCAEEDIETFVPFDGEASLALLKPVAKDFDMVLVDLPRLMLAQQRRLLDEMSGAIIVCDLSLTSLRDARRIRQFLKTVKPDILPLIVANRCGESAFSSIDQASFEKGLEAKIDFLLPEDIKTAKQSAVLGKPVAEIAADTALAKNIAALSRLAAGIKETEKKTAPGSSLFRNLLGKAAHPAKEKT